jgi:hypothetical protein
MKPSSTILYENPQGLASLARQVPSRRRDGPLTPQCLWRWATRGIRLQDGRTVRLEAVRVAGRFLSSLPALERFIAAQNEPIDVPPLPNAVRGQSKRSAASAKAAEKLEAEGF